MIRTKFEEFMGSKLFKKIICDDSSGTLTRIECEKFGLSSEETDTVIKTLNAFSCDIRGVEDLVLELFEVNNVSPDAALHAMLQIVVKVAKREKVELSLLKEHIEKLYELN